GGDGRYGSRRVTLALGLVANGDLVVGGRDLGPPRSRRPTADDQRDGKSAADGMFHVCPWVRVRPVQHCRGCAVPSGSFRQRGRSCCAETTMEDTTVMERPHPAGATGRVRGAGTAGS